jgi:hypothetical protein
MAQIHTQAAIKRHRTSPAGSTPTIPPSSSERVFASYDNPTTTSTPNLQALASTATDAAHLNGRSSTD